MEYKIIRDFPNYCIDIHGDIINVNTGKRIKQTIRHNRMMVELWKNNKKKHQLVHRLIAIEFIPNPHNKPQINHIDGNSLNNNINNLEWVTDSENKYHAYKNNLIVQEKFAVRQTSIDGKHISDYESILSAHRETKVDRKSIKLNLEGKYKQAGGFVWKRI